MGPVRRQAGLALAMLILTLSVSFGTPTQADGVCGDGMLNRPPEQCDDDNLANGDGCSSMCTIERCGNGTLDTGEQCDDGNTVAGDSCNAACQIEFCGDRQIQTGRGEQCDDGNGIGGDGCSSVCTMEGALNSAALSSSPAVPIPSPATHIPPPTNNLSSSQSSLSSATNAASSQSSVSAQTIIRQAESALSFLASPSGEIYAHSLSPEQNIVLGQILQNVKSGRRLTEKERAWAEQIASALEKAKAAQQQRTVDMLKRFIASPISAEVALEKKLRGDQMTDVNAAILQLRNAVTVLPPSELRAQVALNIDTLKRQRINIERDLPANERAQFEDGRPPIDVFTALLSLKEATEKYATGTLAPDLNRRLETIQREVGVIRQALPVFQREYGLQVEEADALLRTIETVSREVTKQDAHRVIAAVNRFLSHLKRRGIIGPADFAGASITLHAAAEAKRIAEETGDPARLAQSGDTRLFVDSLIALAPARYKETFAGGTIFQQRAALREFLAGDERIRSLRATLRRDGQLDFDYRFEEVQRQILAVGSGVRTDDPCSTSMPEALRCTAAYLQDLQDAIRSRSLFSRIVGTLQDFFGIGS